MASQNLQDFNLKTQHIPAKATRMVPVRPTKRCLKQKSRRADPAASSLSGPLSKPEFNGSRLVASLAQGHADVGMFLPDFGPSLPQAGALSFVRDQHDVRIPNANRIDAAISSGWY